MKASHRLFTSLLLAAAAAISSAWIDTGHMLVAEIARKNLRPEVRAKIDALLKTGGDEKTQDMIGASCWADDIKREHRETAPWHYYDQHFRSDGKATDGKPDEENALTALAKFKDILKDKTKSDAERADALRWILHIVGDLHQPLHTVARDSDEEPKGDKGGNDFKIQNPASMSDMTRPITNLHALWDFGCGLYRGTSRPLTTSSSQALESLAAKLSAQYPESSIKGADDVDPMKWLAEGLYYAKTNVYALTPGEAPTEAYMKKGQEICGRRIALAGYRLAHILNDLLK